MFTEVHLPDGIDSAQSLDNYTTTLDKQVRAAQSRLAFARKMQSVLFEGDASIGKRDIERAYFCNDTEQETFVLIVNVPSGSAFLSQLIAWELPAGIEASVDRNYGDDQPEYGTVTKKIVFKNTAPDQ